MKAKITPERLIGEFNYCQKLNNARVTILFTHLFAEHFIHKLGSICGIDSGPSINEMVKSNWLKRRNLLPENHQNSPPYATSLQKQVDQLE